jgi:hypothetical protein
MFFLTTPAIAPSAAADPRSQEGRQSKEQKSKEKKVQSKAREASTSLTGCVDEQDGRYLLLSESSRDPIANLEANGFPAESFAKHLGQKVTVRGTSIPDGARPTIKVRSIETLSDVCAAQQQ